MRGRRTRAARVTPRAAAGFQWLVLTGLVVWPQAVHAFEEHEDLSVSVEVVETFTMSLSDPSLAFHQVRPGDTVVLGEGQSFNEVVCQSNSGRPWYLKAHLVSFRHTTRDYAPPPGRLAWRVTEVIGAGSPEGGRGDFVPFSDQPSVIYVGEGTDQRGEPVTLRFQYRLANPSDAPAGDYIGQLVFTMSERP